MRELESTGGLPRARSQQINHRSSKSRPNPPGRLGPFLRYVGMVPTVTVATKLGSSWLTPATRCGRKFGRKDPSRLSKQFGQSGRRIGECFTMSRSAIITIFAITLGSMLASGSAYADIFGPSTITVTAYLFVSAFCEAEMGTCSAQLDPSSPSVSAVVVATSGMSRQCKRYQGFFASYCNRPRSVSWGCASTRRCRFRNSLLP